jgi:hypothetical protein
MAIYGSAGYDAWGGGLYPSAYQRWPGVTNAINAPQAFRASLGLGQPLYNVYFPMAGYWLGWEV